MDLSSSSPPESTYLINNDITCTTNQHHQLLDNGLEEIVPSYDFHPILPTLGFSHLAGSTLCSASDSSNKPPSTLSSNKGFGSLHSIEPPTNIVPENLLNDPFSEIDRTMMKRADTLLHAMEAVTSRLTQLETRTNNLENLLHDLKVSLDNTHAGTHGKMQSILLEVQSGVQLLNDKYLSVQAQLQVSKVDQHPKTHSVHVDPTAQPPTPVTPQQMPQFPLASFPQPPSSAAALSQPQSSHQSLQPPSSQLLSQPPTQFSPQLEPYCPPPNQLPYKAPPQTQQSHQPPYQPQYPQQPPPPPSGYIPEEHPSYAVQSYSPNPPCQQPPAGSAPSQQFYSAPQPSMYDGAGGRSNSSFPSGYSPESYPYTGLPMASAKLTHTSSSRTGYPQLSDSRPLPMSAAVSSSSGSSSPRSESRVPIDDVIDRVTTMGFPREQVRATVRKLTENGQAVDLNVVLDKLMNEGEGDWFGGR